MKLFALVISVFIVFSVTSCGGSDSETSSEIEVSSDPFTIDELDDVGHFPSIAVSSDGTVHLAYFDLTNGTLNYAERQPQGSWSTEIVDSPQTLGNVGSHNSIAIASDGTLHIVYRGGKDGDFPVYLEQTLKHAWKEPGLSWETEWVETSSAIDDITGGYFSSIAIDSEGTLHVACLDNENSALLHVWKETVGQWFSETVDGGADEDPAVAVGQYNSIGVSSTDQLHISYYDTDHLTLKHATKPWGGVWSTEVVDGNDIRTDDMGMFSSLDIASDDTVHISYWDNSLLAFNLKHAWKSPSDTWQNEVVDGEGVNEMVGQHTSMLVAADGTLYISYSDSNNLDLLLATMPEDESWETQTVSSDGDLGLYTSIAEGPSGIIHIAFHELTLGDLLHVGIDP